MFDSLSINVIEDKRQKENNLKILQKGSLLCRRKEENKKEGHDEPATIIGSYAHSLTSTATLTPAHFHDKTFITFLLTFNIFIYITSASI